MAKPPTRHQLEMALAAIHQVSGFLTDGGFDPEGTKAASLGAAAESLELVRKHWTTETRKKPARPSESRTASPAEELSADPVTLVPEGQDKPAARNAPDPDGRLTLSLAEAAARNAPQSRN